MDAAKAVFRGKCMALGTEIRKGREWTKSTRRCKTVRSSNRLARRKGQGKREGLHRPSSPHHFDVALGGGHVQGRGPRAGVPGLWHGAPVQPAPCVVKQQLLLGPFGCFHIHTWEDKKGG